MASRGKPVLAPACLGKAIWCLAESVEELPLGLCCLWDIEALRVVYLDLGPLGYREPQELPLDKQAQAWPQLSRILVASQGFESLETPARPGPMGSSWKSQAQAPDWICLLELGGLGSSDGIK